VLEEVVELSFAALVADRLCTFTDCGLGLVMKLLLSSRCCEVEGREDECDSSELDSAAAFPILPPPNELLF
jgi:hypothetical protein